MKKRMICAVALSVATAAWAQEADFGAMLKALSGAAQSGQATNAPGMVSPKALKEALRNFVLDMAVPVDVRQYAAAKLDAIAAR